MLEYLYCGAYTRMTMNGSLPSIVARDALQSQMSNACLKDIPIYVLNLVVTDIDLSSFGKLFHEAGQVHETSALKSCGERRVVRSWS